MIRYTLVCARSHRFEGWFKSSVAYDRQAKRGLVACPRCGSAEVTKAVMAPSVKATGEKKRKSRTQAITSAPSAPGDPSATGPETAQTLASIPAPQREFQKLMRKVREHVVNNAEYVGPRFAEEARKIHYEESEKRGIYGEASREEARDLTEEGIEVYPLPDLPEDKN